MSVELTELSREKLEDGNILLSVKERFQDDMNEDNLVDLMQVLRDSTLYIPMRVIMSAADQERLSMVKDGLKFEPQGDIQVVPATSRIEDETYMFMFSQAEQIPVDYSDAVTMMRAPWEKVYEYFLSEEDVNAIVLDPFTENLELPAELLEAITHMESRFPEE